MMVASCHAVKCKCCEFAVALAIAVVGRYADAPCEQQHAANTALPVHHLRYLLDM